MRRNHRAGDVGGGRVDRSGMEPLRVVMIRSVNYLRRKSLSLSSAKVVHKMRGDKYIANRTLARELTSFLFCD